MKRIYLSLTLLLCAACAVSAEAPGVISVVLLDGSCSRTGVEAYEQAWTYAVSQVAPGDRLVLARIRGETIGLRPDVDMALAYVPLWRDNVLERKRRIAKFRTDAADAVTTLLKQPCSSTTPILDALNGAAPFLAAASQRRKRLMILSDMIEDSGLAKFDAVAPRNASSLIARRRRDRALPDFAGTEVVVVGASAPNSAMLREIERFWREFFLATHGRLTNYAAVLLAPLAQ